MSDATQKATILVADDRPEGLALVRAYLHDPSYTIVTAGDGNEALLKVAENHLDLVILDVNMPGRDGFQVLQALRADPATAKARVLMVTGRAEEADVMRGCVLGTDDYIVKPFKAADVAERVKMLLAAS